MNEYLLMVPNFFQALMSNSFLLMALLSGMSASVASGVIGSFVVIKRIVFISGSIAHSVLGGLGIAVFLQRKIGIEWIHPIYGAIIAGILSAVIIGWVHLSFKEREDTVIGSIWALGMSIGVIFTSLTPGYNVEILHFLFGNILWTTPRDVYQLLILDGLVLALTFFFHRKFLIICFDENQAHLQGLRVKTLYLLLLSLIAITVVLLIQVVGAILVIAFLSLPAAIANTFTNRFSKMIFIACGLSMLATLLGLFFAYQFDWPAGATIATTATVLYLLNLIRSRND